MNKTLTILAVVFGIIGCGRNQNIEQEYGRRIDINLTTSDRDSIPYSEFVDSITYLTIQADDSLRIGNIENIRFADTYIAAFDPRAYQVLLFNADGRFVRKIGARGRGHGEFIRPLRMDVDADEKVVLVYDIVQGSVLRYGFDSTYIGKDSIGHASDMAYLGKGSYLVADYNEDTENAGIYRVESNPYRRTKLYGCRDRVPMMKPWEFFRNNGKPSVMSRQYEDRPSFWTASWNWDSTDLFR